MNHCYNQNSLGYSFLGNAQFQAASLFIMYRVEIVGAISSTEPLLIYKVVWNFGSVFKGGNKIKIIYLIISFLLFLALTIFLFLGE